MAIANCWCSEAEIGIHRGHPYRFTTSVCLEDDQKLALLYSAADVFCAPSREENLANTARLESLGWEPP